MSLPPGWEGQPPRESPLVSLENIAVRIFHDSGNDPRVAVHNAKIILTLAKEARATMAIGVQVDEKRQALEELGQQNIAALQTLRATREATWKLRDSLESVINTAVQRLGTKRLPAKEVADVFKAALLAEWRKRIEELLKEES